MPVPLMRRRSAAPQIPQENALNGLRGHARHPGTAVVFLPRWPISNRHFPIRPCVPTPDTLTWTQPGLVCVWNVEIRTGIGRCMLRSRAITS